MILINSSKNSKNIIYYKFSVRGTNRKIFQIKSKNQKVSYMNL